MLPTLPVLTSTTALMMPTFFWKWLQTKSHRSVALPLLCSAMRPFQISLIVFSVKVLCHLLVPYLRMAYRAHQAELQRII